MFGLGHIMHLLIVSVCLFYLMLSSMDDEDVNIVDLKDPVPQESFFDLRLKKNCRSYDWEFDRHGYLLVVGFYEPGEKTRIVDGGSSRRRGFPARVLTTDEGSLFDPCDWSGAPIQGPYVRLYRPWRPPLIISPKQAEAARRFLLAAKGKGCDPKFSYNASRQYRAKRVTRCCYGCLKTEDTFNMSYRGRSRLYYDASNLWGPKRTARTTASRLARSTAVLAAGLVLALLFSTSGLRTAAAATARADVLPSSSAANDTANNPSTSLKDFPADGSKPMTSLSSKQREMVAYDCSEPSEAQAVSLLHDPDIQTCEERKLKEKQREETYLLLQKTEKIKVQLWECEVFNTRMFFACGSASHSAVASRESYFMEPWLQSIEDCNKYLTRKEFHLHRFDNQKLELRNITLNRWNYLTMVRTGWNYNGISDVLCTGGKVPPWELRTFQKDGDNYDNMFMYSMVVTDYVHIRVRKRPAYLADYEGETRLILPETQEVLHCSYQDLGCQTERSTYIWESFSETDLCPFFLLRKVTGVSLEEKSEEEETKHSVFVANNQTMIRLQKSHKAVSNCGAVMFSTEFPELFLSEEIDSRTLNRPLKAEDASAFLHATVSDRYIYYKSQDNLANAVLGLQQHQCEENRKRSLSAYATRLAKQKSVSDGDTAHLGQGLFLTAAGEVAYLYFCREIIVYAAVIPDQCFNALPVELRDEDADHLRQVLTMPGQDAKAVQLPQFFREPRSGRITTVAAPIACVSSFAPLYRNRHNNWLKMMDVGLHPAAQPKNPKNDIPNSFFEVARSELPKPGGASIYPPLTILHHLLFLAVPNMAITAPLQIARGESAASRRMQVPNPHDLVPPSFDLRQSIRDAALDVTGLGRLGRIWAWVEHYGTICSVVIGTVCIYNIIVYLATVWSLLFCNPRRLPWMCHLFHALLPTLANLLIYGRYDPAEPRGPCHGPISTCFGANSAPRVRCPEEGTAEEMVPMNNSNNNNSNDNNQKIYPKLPKSNSIVLTTDAGATSTTAASAPPANPRIPVNDSVNRLVTSSQPDVSQGPAVAHLNGGSVIVVQSRHRRQDSANQAVLPTVGEAVQHLKTH
jgi:hypothetical protein